MWVIEKFGRFLSDLLDFLLYTKSLDISAHRIFSHMSQSIWEPRLLRHIHPSEYDDASIPLESPCPSVRFLRKGPSTMSTEVSVETKVTLRIGDVVHELTLDEARELVDAVTSALRPKQAPSISKDTVERVLKGFEDQSKRRRRADDAPWLLRPYYSPQEREYPGGPPKIYYHLQ